MQRKVAYVFLYRNGIRERSVGILKRYGTAEQPEVALELFGEEMRKKRWDIYYFTKGGALAEAAYLWGSSAQWGTSEVRRSQCRLCMEAGAGEGIVLLPATEKPAGTEYFADQSADTKPEQTNDGRDFREYLCARYDGKEITEEELRAAFCRKPVRETGENPCMESAKKLMEEITKAAGGETSEGQEEESVLVKEQMQTMRRKTEDVPVSGLDKIMGTKPSYTPCRSVRMDYSVRITPEDLYCLPKESKGYIENSYLLHGYYRYRHMLLGRRTRKEKDEYVIMVPGIYNEKEAGLAKLFGFPEFLPAVWTVPETDRTASGEKYFGYFCGKI